MVNKKKKSLPDEEVLMEMTRSALADVLNREPTRQEILRAHIGFKRMAFIMMEHLDRQGKEESGEGQKRTNE